LDDAALAQVLVARMEQKWVARAVQTFWRSFMPPDGVGLHQGAWQRHAMLAVHMGLAAWCLRQSGDTAAARQVLASLGAPLGASARSSAGATASGLLRVFALKDMLA